MPLRSAKPGKTRTPVENEVHAEELDRYDVAILAALQADARLSNAELANRIGLSAAPTWRRVKWLEQQGYITGYRAELDRRRIGLGVFAFVRVDAERNTGRATKELEDAIRRLAEVTACHYISGAGTFELQVMATDLDAFSRFATETLLNLPNVKDIHTSFSLGEVKAGAALPLTHLQTGVKAARRALTMPWRHALLALAVVAIWGSNFVVIKAALETLPPLTLAALRFALAFVPAALFVARPPVAWRVLAAYGVLIGAGQFGLLYIAMRADITPGLASLVVQIQVFFTIGLAMLFARERLKPVQAIALTLAAAGLGVIAWHTDATTTPLGLALVIGAALCWAGGNTVQVRAGKVPMLGFMVWSSAFAVPPLVLLALLVEGPAAMTRGVSNADALTWAAVLWQAAGNALFGYGAWAWLLARHPAATVAPMALLVPVFGIGASALWLGEPLPAWKLAAAALVIGGLAVNLVAPRWQKR